MFLARSLPPVRGLRQAPLWAGLCLALACGGTRDQPQPTISSFKASPPEVEVGEKATLTAVFANGQGHLKATPIASGASVTVDPLVEDTFTLTVTNDQGKAVTATTAVKVKPGLLVEVKGLPEGLSAAVTVEGNGHSWMLTSTQALKDLPPGNYQIEAGDVMAAVGNGIYHPHRPTQNVVIGDSGKRVKILYPNPTLKVALNDDVSLAFVLIPAGSFTMGAPGDDGHTHDFQEPHSVNIAKAFYLAANLTTQAQWQAVMTGLPWMPDPPYWREDPGMPVSTVSWEDIHDQFLPRLAGMVPSHFLRLPSEAEWEYAVRAGTKSRYPWGDDFTKAAERIWFVAPGGDPELPPPQPGTKPANAWGLYDMQGMLLQWVEDAYHPGYAGAPGDGRAWPARGEAEDRCARGTVFNSTAFPKPSLDEDLWASAYRYAKPPRSRHTDFGFRLALDVAE